MVKKTIVGITLGLIAVLAFYKILFTADQIKDTNGADSRLVIIKRDDFLSSKQKAQGHMQFKASGSNPDISSDLKRYNYETVHFSTKGLSGVTPLQATQMQGGQTLVLNIKTVLHSGNLEIAIITPDNKIFKIVEANSEEEIIIPETEEGIYQVKLGGESVKCSVNVTREVG